MDSKTIFSFEQTSNVVPMVERNNSEAVALVFQGKIVKYNCLSETAIGIGTNVTDEPNALRQEKEELIDRY